MKETWTRPNAWPTDSRREEIKRGGQEKDEGAAVRNKQIAAHTAQRNRQERKMSVPHAAPKAKIGKGKKGRVWKRDFSWATVKNKK